MKEYLLRQRTKDKGQRMKDEGVASTDEVGKLFLQEVGQEEFLPLTTLLTLFPDKRVYAFHGTMGAGKTTFTKQLCEELGVTDIVNSPSFAIVNVYEFPAGGTLEGGVQSSEIYHFDCYRLKDIREAYDMGTEEYLYSGSYCFVEWPEMIDSLLPEDTVHITIIPQEDGTRLLTIELFS